MEQWETSEHIAATQSSATTGLYKSMPKIQEAQALPTDRDFRQANARTRDASLYDAQAAV